MRSPLGSFVNHGYFLLQWQLPDIDQFLGEHFQMFVSDTLNLLEMKVEPLLLQLEQVSLNTPK